MCFWNDYHYTIGCYNYYLDPMNKTQVAEALLNDYCTLKYDGMTSFNSWGEIIESTNPITNLQMFIGSSIDEPVITLFAVCIILCIVICYLIGTRLEK